MTAAAHAGTLVQQAMYYRWVPAVASQLDALVVVGRAIGDPTRCAVLLAVLDGVAYPASIAEHLSLSRASVSTHLTCLRGCGLVLAAAEGRRVRYTVADPGVEHALRDLLSVVLAVQPHAHDVSDPLRGV